MSLCFLSPCALASNSIPIRSPKRWCVPWYNRNAINGMRVSCANSIQLKHSIRNVMHSTEWQKWKLRWCWILIVRTAMTNTRSADTSTGVHPHPAITHNISIFKFRTVNTQRPDNLNGNIQAASDFACQLRTHYRWCWLWHTTMMRTRSHLNGNR